MTFRTSNRLAAPLLSLALVLSVPAGATDTAPEKPAGLTGTADAAGMVDLAAHNLPGQATDYDLRARTIGIAPGGAIPNHPHAGRPGIVRVTKGTVIEYRGDTKRVLNVGDSWYENADTVHWFRAPATRIHTPRAAAAKTPVSKDTPVV